MPAGVGRYVHGVSELVLPGWEPGTVCLLATAGEEPHAIPVSTALRAGDRDVLLALGARRGALQRLREDPRVALAVLAAGDLAFTAHGEASVVADPLEGLDGVVAVRVAVDRISEHGRPTFEIESGVGWSWTDEEARLRDEQVRAALLALSAS